MLGELPKLFGKAFIIGFLLPAVVTSFALLHLAGLFGLGIAVPRTADAAIGISLLALAIWLVAVALMALNTQIIRLLEGYGDANPFWLFDQRARRIHDGLVVERDRLAQAWRDAVARGEEPSAALKADYGKVLRRLASEFPHKSHLLLPTRFGNAVRAFEVYPEVVYGLDPITGWSRLVAVIPADYRAQIDDAKAQVDFWVNIWFGALLSLGLYVILAIAQRALPLPLVPLIAIIAMAVAARFARMMVAGWGALVMSAFDLYRKELADRLGLKLPRAVERERDMWNLVGQTMIWRSPQQAEELTRYRKHDDDKAK